MYPSTLNAEPEYEFDVAVSFAGEDREFVEEIVNAVKAEGVRVFYDNDYSVEIWGEDLTEYLGTVYGQKARYAVIFISKSYAEKMWTIYERRVVLSRAVERAETYVLPVRLDDTPLPGLRSSVGYIDARQYGHVGIVNSILGKVRGTLPAASSRLTRTPRTEIERQRLLAERPVGWEQMYLAAQLLHEKEAREEKYRDHRMRFALPTWEVVRSDVAVGYLQTSLEWIKLLIKNFNKAMSPEVQVYAFGPIGQPGDASAIAHMARRWNDLYEGLMDWSARLRGVIVPSEYADVVRLLANVTEESIISFRGFVDDIVSQCDGFPAQIADGRELPELRAHLRVFISDERIAPISAEIDRIVKSRNDDGKEKF
jgi:TIR domain